MRAPTAIVAVVLERGGLALVLATAAVASGCMKRQVAVAPEPPPLVIPAVPPRLVGPVLVQEEVPPPVEEAPERPAEPRNPTRTPRAVRGGGDTAKPAEGNGDSSKPEAQPDAAPPASGEQPPALLRTPETADDTEAIKRVRDILGRAQTNLSKVNYKALSSGAKVQHDQATRFITQAEDALRTRSFTFARYLADKAEIISGSLVNR